MAGYQWGGLHLSRTLLPSATFITQGGHVREVVLSESDLLALIRDAAHALGQRQEAREWNRREDETRTPSAEGSR